MGKGANAVKTENVLSRAPTERPPFTISQLKKAIPPHCFQRSTLRSASYLIIDLCAVAALFWASTYLTEKYFHPLILYAAWPLYWIVQGCIATGIWVIAHECGHQAFSESNWINDSIGFFVHSALMVPYFSWKYSHRRHHSNTGSLYRDEVFVPTKREELPFHAEYLHNPLVRIVGIFVVLTAGWPMYLTFNSSGRKYEGFANHFLPTSPIFNEREKAFILLSDIGLLFVLAVLYQIGTVVGFYWLVKAYLMPLLVVNAFLVLITYLQHTHPSLPHFDDNEWDWLRGALSTVDRDFGILNYVFHHITDTHVAHHMFSTMPHYHAQEATEAIKPILGDFYSMDKTPVAAALWREYRDCIFVAPDSVGNQGIFWYHRKNDE